VKCRFLTGEYIMACTARQEVYNPDPFVLSEFCLGAKSETCPFVAGDRSGQGEGGVQSRQWPVGGNGCVSKRVLVMDDDEIIGNLLTFMLAEHGYKTVVTDNGDAALESFRKAQEEGRPFDFVIIDLNVPKGMNGKETIKKLLQADPEVKAVATSGNCGDPWIEKYRDFGCKEALPKPFTPAKLEQVLASLFPAARI
jgi:CheY-like chemotaxis protein